MPDFLAIAADALAAVIMALMLLLLIYAWRKDC